jgi:hypothetical protein
LRFDPKSFLLGFGAFGLLLVVYLAGTSVFAGGSPRQRPMSTPATDATLLEIPTETPTMGPYIVTPEATATAAAPPTEAPATPGPTQAAATPSCTPATAAEVEATVNLVDTRLRDGTPAEKAIAAAVRAQLDRNGDGKVDDGICHELIVEVNVKLALQLPQ